MSARVTQIRDRLVGLVTSILGSEARVPDPFPTDRQLSELGVSSMKMVNLMLSVEAEFDIAIPQNEITPENFQNLDTIAALVGRILRTSDATDLEAGPLSPRTAG